MKKDIRFLRSPLILTTGLVLAGIGLLSSCKKDDNAKPDKPDVLKFESAAKPSSDNVNTQATGSLTAQYDPATKKLSYTFSWDGLSGEIGGFHIHKGDGAIIINFKDAGYTTATKGTFSGNTVLTDDAWIQDLEGGKLYGQIHTAQFPGGEIRFPFTKKGSSGGGSQPPYTPPVY